MTNKISRRGFLKRSAGAVISASVFGTAYYALDQRPDFPVEESALSVNADYSISDISLANKLAVAEGEDPAELGQKVVDSLGGMAEFISPNDRVVIKPNAAWDRTPEQAACTNPVLIAELVRLCLDAGASEVVVTDVTCHDARRTFARSGIKDAAENAGAKVIFPKKDDFVDVDFGGVILTKWPVLKFFLETDKFINVPVVKNHTLSRATLGMKNLYGILGGNRGQLHQKIDQSIVDLASFLRPTLIVVDAYRVLMRNGPVGGSINDVKNSKTIFATTDQVAADAFACRFLDLDPARVGHIVLAESEGLGSMNMGKFEIIQG